MLRDAAYIWNPRVSLRSRAWNDGCQGLGKRQGGGAGQRKPTVSYARRVSSGDPLCGTVLRDLKARPP